MNEDAPIDLWPLDCDTTEVESQGHGALVRWLPVSRSFSFSLGPGQQLERQKQQAAAGHG